MVRGDAAAALAVFGYFRSIVSGYLDRVPFGSDKDLNVLYRQAILLAESSEIEARLAAAATLPAGLVDFTMIRMAAPSRTLVSACADSGYARRFARDLVASLAPEDALHLHVVDPDAGTMALLDELAALAGPGRFGGSTSRDPHYGTPTAYACARYHAGPLLLERYQRPIVMVDVDLRLGARFGMLDVARPDYDFGCFRTTRREPASVYSAILMVFTPTEPGIAFLRALGLFCLYGLKLPYFSYTWLLDQAALYSLGHHFALTRPDFRFRVLNRHGGEALDFIELVTTDAEKYAMKWDAELQAREARR